jgi:hypothetical protein
MPPMGLTFAVIIEEDVLFLVVDAARIFLGGS